jgi:ribonuclease T2
MRTPAPALAVGLALAGSLLLAATPSCAGPDRAGAFDYYVLTLSWSPTWCALEGDAHDAEQCAPELGFGWLLHGLWPQYETGYPVDCTTAEPDPSRADSAAMADIMGSAGLAWHEWKRHGRCSGLSGPEYYRLSRAALERITRPAILRQIAEPVSLPPSVVEDAFLEANPALGRDAITVTCEEGRIDEVRICLTRDLDLRSCGPDVARDCTLPAALLDPVR